MRASIVILSFNRPKEIFRNISELVKEFFDDTDVEIIIVDNFSEIPVSEIIYQYFPRLKIIRLNENLGVYGRNKGVNEAVGDYVFTIDDDVFGLTRPAIMKVIKEFEKYKSVAAINFRVVDDLTEETVNWIHHRDINKWSRKKFETYEISEGAVAFRKKAFLETKGYPEYFFISHEGPDLSLRLMNKEWRILYCPEVVVRHAHSDVARESWRRYYFDTRNLIWFGVRNLPASIFLKKISIGLISQFLYSARDGFVRYWIKGVIDAIKAIKHVKKDRNPISKKTEIRYRSLHSENVGYLKMFKIRVLGKKGIRI